MVAGPDPEIEREPGMVCARCGHTEPDHVVQEAEIPGGTMRRILCEVCDDYHEFVPDPAEI